MKRTMGVFILWGMLAAVINGCSGSKPDRSAVNAEGLDSCPDRPNCVSSEARDARQSIAPFRLKGDPAAGWEGIRSVVGDLPRTITVKATDRYLHAECKSRIFGFIDDMELQLDIASGVIAIRSASRVGYSDLGVNRRRIEVLRQKLKEDGIIQ
jgi:uncharacterized protein (DUF1499 family)